MSAAQAAQQNNRGPGGQYSFGTHAEPESVALKAPAPRRTRRKSAAVAIVVTGMLASALLTGCTPSGQVIDADYAKVCQDKTTQQRVEDNKCSEDGPGSGHAGWYFLPMGGAGSRTLTNVPAVGQKLTGGDTTVPAGASTKSGVSDKGSEINRGGFGKTSKGGSFKNGGFRNGG